MKARLKVILLRKLIYTSKALHSRGCRLQLRHSFRSLHATTLSLLSMQDMVSVHLGSTALKRLPVAAQRLLLEFAGSSSSTLEYAGYG
jgi:hypothetical protein